MCIVLLMCIHNLGDVHLAILHIPALQAAERLSDYLECLYCTCVPPNAPATVYFATA